MTPQALVPALLVPLIGYRIYRRVRKTIGRQPIEPKRMIVRIVVLSAAATAFLLLTFRDTALFGAVAGGLVLGVIVALVGLHLTQFELSAQGSFYTPNRYIGVAVSALLVGRIVYRIFAAMPAAQFTAQHATNPDDFAPLRQGNPLTMVILMLTIGYYLAYFAGVLLKARAAQRP